jgi:hypothetical protein
MCIINPTSLAHLTAAVLHKKHKFLAHLSTAQLHKAPLRPWHIYQLLGCTRHPYLLGTLINHSAAQETSRPWHTYQPLSCARNPTSQAHLSTTQLYKKPHPSYGSYPHSICLISLLWARKVQLPHLRNISLISFLILLPHLHQNPGLCGRYSDYATGCTSELFWCNFT